MVKYLVFILFAHLVAFSQQTAYVDFKRAKIDVAFDVDSLKVIGGVEYLFEVLKPIDSVFIDAKNMHFNRVVLNNEEVEYKNDLKRLWIYSKLKQGSVCSITLEYTAKPKKALYFIDWKFNSGNKQVWTQGQGKYTSNWLPSFDDMNEKVEFDMRVTFDKKFEVIANGELVKKETEGEAIKWHYNMKRPMSSYLVALAIGRYNKKIEYSNKESVSLEMYFYPEDSLKVEPTYRYSKKMFDFLEEEIGVSYPWQNYKQVPLKDFLYAGMENTSATFFSDVFVTDSIAFVDKNYVNVNAHELAHQWFGNMVTETSGVHHWLQEGFATYYALLAERDVFGDEYYYWRLFEYAQELLVQDKEGQSTSLLNPKSSSVTFYKKGAWALHILREKVGDVAFRLGVKNYLMKHQFKNVETGLFIKEVEKVSNKDLSEFVVCWLEDKQFDYDAILRSLKKQAFIESYLLANCKESLSNCDDLFFLSDSDKVKIKIIKENPAVIKKENFNSSIKVRQAIAEALSKIPLNLKNEYETLLEDKSYITIEVALFNLWSNFKEDRVKYLVKTKNIVGFRNKNIRILWLALALVSEGFEVENRDQYLNELIGYTGSGYGFEIRQRAFQYLMNIEYFDEKCKENLKQATKHHNWQFSKFAKQLLKNYQ